MKVGGAFAILSTIGTDASGGSMPEPGRYERLTGDELMDSWGREATLYRPVNQGLGKPLERYTGTDMPTIDTAGGPYPTAVIGGVEYLRLDGTIGWDLPPECQDDAIMPYDPETDHHLMQTGDLLRFDESGQAVMLEIRPEHHQERSDDRMARRIFKKYGPIVPIGP